MDVDRFEQIAKKYDLPYQVNFARALNEIAPFHGKHVLEIGGSNLPRELVLDVFGAKKWTSFDLHPKMGRPEWDKHIKSITRLEPNDVNETSLASDNYVLFVSRIQDAPKLLDGRFDIAISIACFEHIRAFPEMLDSIHSLLKDGGCLASMFSPIWSSPIGHHLGRMIDKAGREYTRETFPFPLWGHLLMSPSEMHAFLLRKTDRETAAKITYMIYSREDINRFFVEDYMLFFANSLFSEYHFEPFGINDVSPELQATLEERHPGKKIYGCEGLKVTAIK